MLVLEVLNQDGLSGPFLDVAGQIAAIKDPDIFVDHWVHAYTAVDGDILPGCHLLCFGSFPMGTD